MRLTYKKPEVTIHNITLDNMCEIILESGGKASESGVIEADAPIRESDWWQHPNNKSDDIDNELFKSLW